MFGADDDSPSFWDLVDVINPLQHIPLVNDVYREMTGDKIGIAARLSGGALFGGVIGLIGAALNGVLEESTGATAGGHMLALFRDESTPDGSGTALAQAVPPPAQAQAAKDDPAQTQTAESKTATTTDARPIILADMIGDEPAAPAAMPRAPVSTSAAAPVETAQAAQAAQAASEPAAISVAATAGSANAWTSRAGRTLSMPARTTPLATRSPPAVATAISGNSGRSALPVTGARPQSGLIAPGNAAPIVAAQADTPQSDGAKNAAATPVANDWFAAAMAEGLNKYQKSNARAAETAAP